MQVQILDWDKTSATTVEIFELVKRLSPHFVEVTAEDAVQMMQARLSGFEDSLSVARVDGKLVGFMFLSRGRNARIAELHGGVDPEMWRRGIGGRLFEQTRSKHAASDQIKQLSAYTFKSTPGGPIALERWGFSCMDRVHSSSYVLSSPTPEWASARASKVRNAGIRFMDGEALKMLNPKWEQAWWRLDNSTVDIPSEVKFEPISFELWSAAAQPPLCQLDHTLFALDERAPIASLRLGPLRHGAMNINFTNVTPDYRRRGISIALKLEAFKLAKRLGAREVTTQNHQHNPILSINQRLGFTETDIIYEYLYTMPQR